MSTNTIVERRSRAPMTAARKATLAAGVLYLVTFVSIPAYVLIVPVLDDPTYILTAGDDTRILLGCLLDVVTALACIGTAVALFPVLRRHDETPRWASSPPACTRPASFSSGSSACWPW